MGETVGYAPEKRWSPSTVGRKRKYRDWFSCTRDRTPRSRYATRLLLLLIEFSFSAAAAVAAAAAADPPSPPILRRLHHLLPFFPGPRVLVGTDSRFARYANLHCAIRFCPLTHCFPRLPLEETSKTRKTLTEKGPAENARSTQREEH